MSIYGLIKRSWWYLPGFVRKIFVGNRCALAMKEGIKTRLRGLADYDEQYDKEFYLSVAKWEDKSVCAIAESVVRDIDPESIIDVGCGTGALMQEFLKRSVAGVYGVELAEEALALCREKQLQVFRCDLTAAKKLPFPFADIVICLEVAEHIPPDSADHLVGLLTDASSRVLLSAAPRGQGGQGHVNEQPKEYWVKLFRQHGFTEDRVMTASWKREWQEKGVLNTYFSNSVLFSRAEGFSRKA